MVLARVWAALLGQAGVWVVKSLAAQEADQLRREATLLAKTPALAEVRKAGELEKGVGEVPYLRLIYG